MSEFFWNTVTENMKFVLNGVSKSEIGKHFYLARGTALALQLGHRISVDLDFFSPTEDIPTIRPTLDEAFAAFDGLLADSHHGGIWFTSSTTCVSAFMDMVIRSLLL
jgi:nucleotidyltransferase AbiEii toxin of type IV toxin-antitoxin system